MSDVIFIEISPSPLFQRNDNIVYSDPIMFREVETETTTLSYYDNYMENTNLDGVWIGATLAGVLVMLSIGLSIFIKFFNLSS